MLISDSAPNILGMGSSWYRAGERWLSNGSNIGGGGDDGCQGGRAVRHSG